MLNKPLHAETKKACLSQLPPIKHRIWLPEHRMCRILNWWLTAVLDCSWVSLQGLSSHRGNRHAAFHDCDLLLWMGGQTTLPFGSSSADAGRGMVG